MLASLAERAQENARGRKRVGGSPPRELSVAPIEGETACASIAFFAVCEADFFCSNPNQKTSLDVVKNW